jgi:hypothetical protein
MSTITTMATLLVRRMAEISNMTVLDQTNSHPGHDEKLGIFFESRFYADGNNAGTMFIQYFQPLTK